MFKRKLSLVALSLLVFAIATQAWSANSGIVVAVKNPATGSGNYTPKPTEEIWGAGYSGLDRYWTGDNSKSLFQMFPYSGVQTSVSSRWAGFVSKDGYVYYNDYLATNGALIQYLGNSPVVRDDWITIPQVSKIQALAMGRPAAGERFRMYTYTVNGEHLSPVEVVTNAQGIAEFRAPAYKDMKFGQFVNGDMYMFQNSRDYCYPVRVRADGTFDFNPDVNAVHNGGTATVNVITNGRPVFNSIEAGPFDATRNVLYFSWENLSAIPNHSSYQLLLYETDGKLFGWQNMTENSAGFALPVNKTLNVIVVGVDKYNTSYCTSLVYGFNTGGPLYQSASSARMLSNDSEVKTIIPVIDTKDVPEAVKNAISLEMKTNLRELGNQKDKGIKLQ